MVKLLIFPLFFTPECVSGSTSLILSNPVLGCPPGAHGALPDHQGQPGCTAAPHHLSGPQARVGPLQRVRPHHKELH